jgi:hypothetical protein
MFDESEVALRKEVARLIEDDGQSIFRIYERGPPEEERADKMTLLDRAARIWSVLGKGVEFDRDIYRRKWGVVSLRRALGEALLEGVMLEVRAERVQAYREGFDRGFAEALRLADAPPAPAPKPLEAPGSSAEAPP